MSEFVQYHNVEKEGGPPKADHRLFHIWTSKPNLHRILGHRVWLISGAGKPRRYALHYWFTPNRVEGDGLVGIEGARASNANGVPLDDYPWFRRLYVEPRLYSLGLQQLSGKSGRLLVEELERLSEKYLTRRDPVSMRSPATEGRPSVRGGLDGGAWTEDAARSAVRLQSGMRLDAEGERRLVTHFLRERAPQARRQFLASREEAGRMTCDACAVDLGVKYGRIFSEVVEVHHTLPLSEGARKTRPEHLALLCPTCHRVAHFRREEPRPVDEVRRIVDRTRRMAGPGSSERL